MFAQLAGDIGPLQIQGQLVVVGEFNARVGKSAFLVTI